MSSRRRLYLNLKSGIVSLFKTPAHYLKELTGKHSLFEKPYLDKDYRQMHLNLPVPSWKRPEFDPGGIWPKPRKHTFVFDDGICSFSGQSGECGETIFLSGWIGLVPFGSEGREIAWVATSFNSEGAQVVGISLSLGGMSASIEVKLGNDFTGTVTVCAKAFMVGGSTLKEIAYRVPSHIGGVPTVPGWVPSFPYAARNLLPIYEIREEGGGWDCGCVDLEVDCGCVGATWDSATSAETVARNGSCTVAITGGGSGTKTWSVSGTGFWFDSDHTITTLGTIANSVTLYADETACGLATITACGATGYVRCTAGDWVQIDSCSQNGGSSSGCGTYYRENRYRYDHCAHCCKPDECGSARNCCDWHGWFATCAYCDSNPSYPEYTSTAITTIRYEWQCV